MSASPLTLTLSIWMLNMYLSCLWSTERIELRSTLARLYYFWFPLDWISIMFNLVYYFCWFWYLIFVLHIALFILSLFFQVNKLYQSLWIDPVHCYTQIFSEQVNYILVGLTPYQIWRRCRGLVSKFIYLLVLFILLIFFSS